MPTRPTDPLALHAEPTRRLTVTLTERTLLALYHYCLARDADATKMPRAAATIISTFLTRDATLKRWRTAQGAAAPTTIPRSSHRAGRHA
jgi:hypothetical protein